MKEGKIQDPFRMLDGMRGIAAPRERGAGTCRFGRMVPWTGTAVPDRGRDARHGIRHAAC